MKTAKVIILIFSFVVVICMVGCGTKEKTKTLEKNYGYSYGTVNVGSDGAQTFSADEVVPSKSDLSENLKNAGFAIAEYDTAPGSDIAAERIYAEKSGKFIDICYGLSVEQAAEIFTNYESTYKDYYLIAQNGAFVYAVSDEKTFEIAGFETLETDGMLFIWK